MSKETDPLAQLGFDTFDLKWTLRDIAARRTWFINKEHLAKLIEHGFVALREDTPYLTEAGQKAIWDD
jgi:hypothetical protein